MKFTIVLGNHDDEAEWSRHQIFDYLETLPGFVGEKGPADHLTGVGNFIIELKQANTDSSKMAEVVGVSEAQLRFVTNTSSGMGLIKCGSVVIPFDNQISKDTNLYKLYNTNIHEKIAEQKAKEAALARAKGIEE